MIVAVTGIFKQPTPPPESRFEALVNEHLSQPRPRIINAGYLCDDGGERIGVLALLEVDAFADARRFIEASPFQEGGRFERIEVAEYDVEVGRLG